MATLQCDVVSAKGPIYSGTIRMLIATGSEGELGILPGHTPLITLLKPGPLRIRIDDNKDNDEYVYIKGGVLEVQPHRVTILADSAELASTLDEARLEEERRKTQELINSQKTDFDMTAAYVSLAETVAQLQTIRKYRNRT